MRMPRPVSLATFALLGILSARAQSTSSKPIVLLKLSSPNGREPVPVPAKQHATDTVYLSYHADRPTQEPLPSQILVRVFRGRKSWLIGKMPQFFKTGCVEYSSALLEAYNSGQIALQGLDIRWLTSSAGEDLTLVFEVADPDSVGVSNLRLARDPAGIAAYFNSGIEIHLQAPGDFVMPAPVTSAPRNARQPAANQIAPISLPPCHVVGQYQATTGSSAKPQAETASLRIVEAPCGS